MQLYLACHERVSAARSQEHSALLVGCQLVTNANLPSFVLRSHSFKQKAEVNDMTRNPIGLLETSLQISAAKENGCDQGDCSCGEGDDCLATGWENFVPQPKQPAQSKQPKYIL